MLGPCWMQGEEFRGLIWSETPAISWALVDSAVVAKGFVCWCLLIGNNMLMLLLMNHMKKELLVVNPSVRFEYKKRIYVSHLALQHKNSEHVASLDMSIFSFFLYISQPDIWNITQYPSLAVMLARFQSPSIWSTKRASSNLMNWAKPS